MELFDNMLWMYNILYRLKWRENSWHPCNRVLQYHSVSVDLSVAFSLLLLWQIILKRKIFERRQQQHQHASIAGGGGEGGTRWKEQQRMSQKLLERKKVWHVNQADHSSFLPSSEPFFISQRDQVWQNSTCHVLQNGAKIWPHLHPTTSSSAHCVLVKSCEEADALRKRGKE